MGNKGEIADCTMLMKPRRLRSSNDVEASERRFAAAVAEIGAADAAFVAVAVPDFAGLQFIGVAAVRAGLASTTCAGRPSWSAATSGAATSSMSGRAGVWSSRATPEMIYSRCAIMSLTSSNIVGPIEPHYYSYPPSSLFLAAPFGLLPYSAGSGPMDSPGRRGCFSSGRSRPYMNAMFRTSRLCPGGGHAGRR